MAVDGVGTYSYKYYYDSVNSSASGTSKSYAGYTTYVLTPWYTIKNALQEVISYAQCFYDLNGHIILQKTPRVDTVYTYNEQGQTESLRNKYATGTTGADSFFRNMTYDPSGNMLGYTYTINNVVVRPGQGPSTTTYNFNGTVSYTYDDKDQLINETRTCSAYSGIAYNVSYSYDSRGNATSVRGVNRSYNINNQVSGHIYDANGNTIEYGSFEFEYDYEDLPSWLYGGKDGDIVYLYRADGLRAAKESNTWSKYFIYDGDKVVAEFNTNGSLETAYLYTSNGLVQRREGESAYRIYTYDPLGSLAQTHYVAGSTTQLHRTAIFDAFGKRVFDRTNTGNNYPEPDAIGYHGKYGAYTDQETRLRPTSLYEKLIDDDTPLVLMGVRYYDPILARFVTRDPVLSINDYTFCHNNPVKYIDPDGDIAFVPVLILAVRVGMTAWAAYNIYQDVKTFIEEPSIKNGLNIALGIPGGRVKGAGSVIKTAVRKSGKSIAVARQTPKSIGNGINNAKKNVPNPNGKKGGLVHQGKVQDTIDQVQSRKVFMLTKCAL